MVSGVGTGGTLVGCSRFLKSKKPDVKIVAVEPVGCAVLSGEKAGPHGIAGIGAGFIPGNMGDLSDMDEVVQVTAEESFAMAKRMIAEEGMMVGHSAGSAAKVALDLAAKKENKGKMIVFILPSFGERYLSTALFADITE